MGGKKRSTNITDKDKECFVSIIKKENSGGVRGRERNARVFVADAGYGFGSGIGFEVGMGIAPT
jgi:hypothetical protein